MNPLRHFLAAGMMTLGSALAGWSADITHTIQSLQITNVTGYVIDADASTAHNREHLLVESRVQTASTSGLAVFVEYYLRYRLLNSAGQPHPIYDSTGVVSGNSTYNLTNNFFIAPGATVNRTDVAALRPSARLNPSESYTVELRVFTPGGFREADLLTNSPQTFYHFTNLVSNDPGFNVIATVDNVAFSRVSAVQTDPDRRAFQADVEYTLRRYDNFAGASGPADNVPITLSYELFNATTGASIPLVSNSTNFNRLLLRNVPPDASNPVRPFVSTSSRTIDIQPAADVQLDSVNRNYRLVVTVSHLEQAGVPASEQTGNELSSPATKLLHFNGRLWFGATDTTFTSIDNDPTVGLVQPGVQVFTTLSVDNQSGTIPGLPGFTYGNGTDLDVRLLANGDAISDDPVPLNVPPGGIANVNNVRVEVLAPATLTPDGLVGGLRVHLPTGMGYRTDTAGRILKRSFIVTGIPLGKNLRPLNDVTFTPPVTLQVVDETKPLWIGTSSIVWRVGEGRFEFNTAAIGVQHVRTIDYTQLEAVHSSLDNSHRSQKRSNDRLYQSVQVVNSPVIAEADPNSVARVSMDLALGDGDYRTHFPYDAHIQWNGGGTLQIAQDQVTTNSLLNGVELIGLSYGTGCTGVDCGDGANVRVMRLQPTNGVLHFTPDGGLVAGGTLDAPHRLSWGSIEPLNAFAHESFEFPDANFHMPGHFLRGDQTELVVPLRSAAILYTGVAATNTASLERPDVPGTLNQTFYERGYADYAGMNVAVGSDGTRQGHSTLAGTPTGTYQLKGISKYYARRGGVSGIHDAVFNSFPPTLTLYGYRFDFTNFGLNCLDNRMRDSRIDGLIDIPYPSQFIQEFAGLRLNCLGAIESAPMPRPGETKSLAYWNGSFEAQALQFRHDPEDLCNVTNAFLTIGARTQISHVTEVLYGTLGFQTNGDLLPRAIGPADIDSRLKLPNLIHVAGPRGEKYALNPVADVYFNSYFEAGSETNVGWVNIAATMDVPFFEDLQVHLQTSASGNTNAPIFVMGGWPAKGWQMGGKNYFTADYFDDANRGYGGPSPAGYQNSGSDLYRARAQRTWLNVIPFDYPLSWSSVTRDFRSFEPKVNKLMVLSTENELKYLSAANAEIAFGAQFDGLPQFNLANIAFQAIDAATAAGNGAVADLLTKAVGGFGRLDEILAADLNPFFSGIFDESIQPRIDEFYGRLETSYEIAGPGGWLAAAGNDINVSFETDAESIHKKLQGLPGLDPGEAGMMKRLTNYLGQAETAVAQIREIIREEDDGSRMIASQLMRLLVDNLAAQFAGTFIDELVQPILAEADPTLDQITEVLGNLEAALAQVRTTMAGGMGDELNDLFLAHAPEITTTLSSIKTGVGDYLEEIDLALDDPFEDYSPDEIKQAIRREIEDQFYGSPVVAAVQVVHKNRLYDVDAAIRQATDTVFQQLNALMRDIIGETAAELNNAFTKLISPLEDIAAAAKINGYAHINGDSLKEARVDLHTRLELGSTLEFNGYLQIKELDSKGSPGCAYDGTDAITEVTLGAEDVQVGWISPDLRASVGTKFTFNKDGDGFPLRGLGGSFELTGKLEYEAFAINYLGAALALGQDENFLSGAAGMRVNKYDVFGGIYFGKACTIAPIELWDPDAAKLLGNGSFTGIYAYGEGWIPINELIGIPASCLFNISAGLGMGAGVFLEGPTFLAKMTAGVSGEALCAINIMGKLTGTGVLEGLDANVLDGLTVKAKGTVGGKVGPCPFCLELEQSVALTFKQGKWKLDF